MSFEPGARLLPACAPVCLSHNGWTRFTWSGDEDRVNEVQFANGQLGGQSAVLFYGVRECSGVREPGWSAGVQCRWIGHDGASSVRQLQSRDWRVDGTDQAVVAVRRRATLAPAFLVRAAKESGAPIRWEAGTQ